MNRTERLSLDAGSSASKRLLSLPGHSQCWRMIEAWSVEGHPWELRLSWTLGNGSGTSARLSVAHAIRVSVFAADVQLDAINRSSVANQVGAAVVDGQVPSSNVYDVWATCDGLTPVVFDVPPFAHRFDLQLRDRQLLASTLVKLKGGMGEYIQLNGDTIPASGLAVGSIDSIEVLTSASMPLRAIFYLSL